jgi:tripartite-type tricarboxylate transporter receptor subunit TctC
MPSIQRRTLLSAMAGSALVPSAAFSQGAKYPNKPIRIVVAFPPGGLTDAYARMYAEQLTAKFGIPAVVENRPGAGAVIGIDAVAKSAPDGYTLLMTTSGTVWQNRVLYTKLPYNLDKDLTPIALFPSGPLVMAVPEKLPIRNYSEFVEFAKKNQTSMGSYSPGSHPHMIADQINRSVRPSAGRRWQLSGLQYGSGQRRAPHRRDRHVAISQDPRCPDFS